MPLGRNTRHEELFGGACDSWRSPPRTWWRTTCRHPPLEEHPARALRSPPRTRCWSLAGRGLVGNLSGHSPASALSPKKVMSINIPHRGLFLKNGGVPYRCGDVSIRTAPLFRLLGQTDPCRSAAVGSASRLEGTSCEAPLVYSGQK